MSVDDEHEWIVRGVLVGDLHRDDAQVRRHLQRCADCCARLDRLGGLAERLDDLGETERSDLRELAEGSTEMDADFEKVLRRAHRRDRPSTARRWVLAAAAVLLVVFAAYRRLPRDDRDGDIQMGGGGVELVTPEGTVQGTYGIFRWEFEVPRRGYFLLEIVDDTPDGRGTIVLSAKRLEENEWDPATEPALRLPARIRWSVRAYDGEVSLGSGAALAERSSD